MADMIDTMASIQGMSRADYLDMLAKQQREEKASNGGVIKQAPQRQDEARQAAEAAAIAAKNPSMFSGVDPVDLPQVLKNALGSEATSINELAGKLDQVKDPELAAYIGDIMSRVGPSQETIGDQRVAQAKLWQNTNVQETAAEKLMREVARRNMENQMKGDREALAQNLKSRGVYGSGAELAGNLSSMQEQASRRSLEEMQANAGAQKRAMDALTLFGNQAGKMRDQELGEAQAQDAVGMFNNRMKEQHNLSQANVDAQTADRQARRAATVADAKISGARQGGNYGKTLSDAAITTVSGAGGNAVAGGGLTQAPASSLASGLQQGSDTIYANMPADGIVPEPMSGVFNR